MMPGKIVSPERSLLIRLSRSSSLTLRLRSLCSEKALLRNSPRVRGRVIRASSRLYAHADFRLTTEELVYEPIAAGSLANAQSLLNSGNRGAIVLNQRFNPLGFRLHFQKLLLEIQVHGKIVRELERERQIIGLKLDRLSQHFKELLVQLDHGCLVGFGDLAGVIVKAD